MTNREMKEERDHFGTPIVHNYVSDWKKRDGNPGLALGFHYPEMTKEFCIKGDSHRNLW